MLRSTLLLLVAVPSAFLMACSSDTTSGTTSGGGSSPTTTTTGAGGAGGSASTSSGTGTGGDAATTTTTSTSSTGTGTSSSASGSTGTGMMAMGACTNAADLGIVQTKDVKTITADCGKANIGQDAKVKACIKMGTNLSDPCVTCFADTVSCVVNKCLMQCITDTNSQACKDCRATNCDPAFVACSGLPSN
jgi:hypothetical protein